MGWYRSWIAYGLFLLGIVGSTSAQESSTERFEHVAQRLVDGINVLDYPTIRQDFSQAALNDLSLERSKLVFPGLLAQFGKIKELGSPRWIAPNQVVFPAHCVRGDMDIVIGLDGQKKIITLLFGPARPAIPVPDRLKTSFRLPFEDRWLVLWGGDTRELNHHHDAIQERFAFDFLIVDQAGRHHQGEGRDNKDYYAFGRPVVAPANGVVTDVVTGIRDNSPGSMNPSFAGGNTVMIMHNANEVSVLCHLQQDSILVKRGDTVKRGQTIALCGNSGCSSEPHVHFHVQNTPITQDATGLRCVFDSIVVTKDGKSESRTNCFPVKGDIVREE